MLPLQVGASSRREEAAARHTGTSNTPATTVLVASARSWTDRVLLPALRNHKGIAQIGPVLACTALVSAAIESLRPDLLLLDVALLEASAPPIPRLCTQIQPTKLVLLMDAIDTAWAREIMANAVHGVVFAGSSGQRSSSALRKIGEGELWLPRWLLSMALKHCRAHHFTDREERPPPAAIPLTEREREIATLAARGLSNKEIAAIAAISIDTVKRHLKHVFTKLRIHHRTQITGRLREPR